MGVQDQYGHSGPAAEVLRDYGLSAEAIRRPPCGRSSVPTTTADDNNSSSNQ